MLRTVPLISFEPTRWFRIYPLFKFLKQPYFHSRRRQKIYLRFSQISCLHCPPSLFCSQIPGDIFFDRTHFSFNSPVHLNLCSLCNSTVSSTFCSIVRLLFFHSSMLFIFLFYSIISLPLHFTAGFYLFRLRRCQRRFPLPVATSMALFCFPLSMCYAPQRSWKASAFQGFTSPRFLIRWRNRTLRR